MKRHLWFFNITILFQILDNGPESAAAAGEDQLPAHQAAVQGPGPAVWGHRLPSRQQGGVQPQEASPAPHRVDEAPCESLSDICAETEHVCNCILIILYQTQPSIKRDVRQWADRTETCYNLPDSQLLYTIYPCIVKCCNLNPNGQDSITFNVWEPL